MHDPQRACQRLLNVGSLVSSCPCFYWATNAVRICTDPVLPGQVKATRGFWTHEAPHVRVLAGQALAPLFRRAPDKALRAGLRGLVAGVLAPLPVR